MRKIKVLRFFNILTSLRIQPLPYWSLILLLTTLFGQCNCNNHSKGKAAANRADERIERPIDPEIPKRDPNPKVVEQLTALEKTAATGNATQVRDQLETLLKQGMDINAPGPAGATALHYMAHLTNDPTIIKELLNKGASINSKNDYGETPLYLAVCAQSPETVDVLLKAPGIDVNSPDKNGITPLVRAIYKDNEALVKTLLDHKAQVDIPDSKGLTPLYHAVNSYCKSTIKLLLDKGVSKNSLQQALHRSIYFEEYQQHQATKLLLEKAIEMGVAQDILTSTNEEGEPMLSQILRDANQELIQFLLRQGFDLNSLVVRSKYKDTGNQHADLGRLRRLFRKAAYEAKKDSVNTPQEPTTKDGDKTPITDEMIAAVADAFPKTPGKFGYEVLLPVLHDIKNNPTADINNINGKGYQRRITAPHQAASFGDTKIVQALLERKAEVNIKSSDTPLHWAAQHGYDPELIVTLLKYGADINAQDAHGDSPLHYTIRARNRVTIEALLKAPAINLNVQDKIGNTPLIVAIMYQDEDLVNILLEKGADPNIANNNKTTPLHAAILINNETITQKLLDKGANIKAINVDGNSLLHLAISYKASKNIVNLFLAQCDKLGITKELLNTPNQQGKTPLTDALEECNKELIKLLLDKGADVELARKNIQDQAMVDSLLRQINYSK